MRLHIVYNTPLAKQKGKDPRFLILLLATGIRILETQPMSPSDPNPSIKALEVGTFDLVRRVDIRASFVWRWEAVPAKKDGLVDEVACGTLIKELNGRVRVLESKESKRSARVNRSLVVHIFILAANLLL